jgi:hypothetical protein
MGDIECMAKPVTEGDLERLALKFVAKFRATSLGMRRRINFAVAYRAVLSRRWFFGFALSWCSFRAKMTHHCCPLTRIVGE